MILLLIFIAKLLLPPFQIISHFDFFWYIEFTIYLDIRYI
jgi:hypothetical protein